MRDQHSILALCQQLEVSPRGYSDWRRRQTAPGPRVLEDQILTTRITELHAQSRETYGSPRLVREWRKSGARHGRNRVARLMKPEGRCGRQKARYRVPTTDSNHDQPIAPHRLAAAPQPTAPHPIWVADITYIQTGENGLFLAAIRDLYRRKIVGWARGDPIDTALILKALIRALLHRQPPENLRFHSDRGVQYASADYRNALARAGRLASMSRKGNCYDNAALESCWSTLKLERVYRRNFQTRAHARREIFDYLEVFYNRQRSHSALNYLSPVDFETKNN